MLSRRISFVLSLFSRLFDGYKFHILILAVLGLVSGLLESIGISMLIPIFSIIVGETVPGAGTLPQIVVTIFAYFENLRPDFIIPLSRWVSAWLGRPVNSNLIWLLSLVPIFFIIKTVLVSVFSYINLRVVSSFELDTRSRLYQKTLFANWPYLLRQKIGYLENTLMLDVRMTAKLMNQFTSIILDASSFLMYAAVAITISLNITLVTLAVGLAIFIVNQLFMKKTREYTKQQTVLNKVIAHHINEHISGIKMLKASHVEQAVF
jgi:ATP-binding cassette, subfamily B, bacterial MsbA